MSKSLEFALSRLEKRRGAKRLLAGGYQPDYSEIFLHHGLKQEICFNPGPGNAAAPAGMPALVEREKGTGRPMLKIPLPDPEVIQTVLASLGTLLGGLTKGREQ